MANRILNASGLDGVTDWTGATGVDEEVIGAEGRIVLVSTAGDLRSNVVPLEPTRVVEIAGLHYATGGDSVLELEWMSGGVVVGTEVVALRRRARGTPRRGLPQGFHIGGGRHGAPVGATGARLRARGVGSVYLLKPFLETIPGQGDSVWAPGPHSNPDLNLPSWPTKLPPMTPDSFSVDPIPLRRGFTGDTGVESTRRMSATPRFKLQGELSLTMDEQDRLETFFRGGAEPFWIVRYDNQTLCRATWLADGEPRFSGSRLGRRSVSIGLQLEVS